MHKELREFIEGFAKKNQKGQYAIVCTSTLELGIDIGSVDLVVQVDSTFSVASLSQRLGRSGRKEGVKSNLLLCATERWNLLQSIACFELLKEGFIEPLKTNVYPIDILFHQILSVLKETSGIDKDKLFKKIRLNYTFEFISKGDIVSLLKYMIKSEYIENINSELILGLEGEKLVNSRDFYTVFQTPDYLKVVTKNKTIGEIPPSPQIIPDQNILLAAKIWKILDVDFSSKKIFVEKALDGKKPLFFGSGGNIHHQIRQKMLDLIKGKQKLLECNDDALKEINTLRKEFAPFIVNDLFTERPAFYSENKIRFYSFTGTKVNNTLFFLLKQYYNQRVKLFEKNSLFEIEGDFEEFKSIIDSLIDSIGGFDQLLFEYIEKEDKNLSVSKWGTYLSKELKQKLILIAHFDIQETIDYLLKLKVNTI